MITTLTSEIEKALRSLAAQRGRLLTFKSTPILIRHDPLRSIGTVIRVEFVPHSKKTLRSLAAQRGNRDRIQAFQKRSDAARKGWATRRAKASALSQKFIWGVGQSYKANLS